ncbi:MAG: DNA polymerase III subunit alpha [Coprobacter sp.]|nr:DNA polymerase III subunit alpha [Coprobacter sp.]
MQPFVHLHVHTQYSVLDGQASVSALVDKAMADGMPGIAITDHGNMFGVKEFYNYIKKKNGKLKDAIKSIESKIADVKNDDPERESKLAELQAELEKAKAKKPFKPIIGCEMYVARKRMQDKNGKEDQSGYHLIVLAKNEKGYHNLIKLVSKAWTEGFYMRPRTDRVELEKYKEGLIVASACLGGEVPQKIMKATPADVEEAIMWYKNMFGDDYYLEMQRHKATVPNANHDTYEKQQQVNEQLIEYARKFGIKLICTNDVHFVDEVHADAHERLICLNTGRTLRESNPGMGYSKQEWMKTTAEMNEVFGDIPEALSNTLEIIDKVETYSIDHAPIMPTFAIPEEFGTEEEYRRKYTDEDIFNEFTRDENGNVVLSQEAAEKKIKVLGGYDKLYRIKLEADYLKKLAYDGAYKRYGNPLDKEIEERIIFELHIMKTMGFPGYFLIVQDFIAAARNMGVSVGPGRGSAAGSAVAYCLGITQIDPIKYDLLFERFLNPDRISLPDIDIDFDDDGRGEVLRWVTEKYGHEKVAHIITYGTMATKMSIKDVARVEELPLSESNRLTKLIPARLPEVDGKSPKVNFKNCLAAIPELRAACETEETRDTMKYAQMLEGNVRGTGVHACGTIICRDDITDWVPVSTADDKETGEKLLVTQYEGSVIEDTGLIKMDFLGLKTLSIIKEAIANVKLSRGIDVDIDTIDINDPATYKLYSEGRTVGTFQFESAGMQKYLRELQPSTFEDLIAMNALYRPGPMKYIPSFIKRKHGQEPITYDIPIMEKYLKDTYGITVYQEQVMLLSRMLANFTRGQSDGLRKAMGKKLKDKLDELKPLFLNGGEKNGHDRKVLEKIWADWEDFASYAFNKSHATCYSWVAYQTAYLKANFPSEYMAAVLSRSISDIGEITKFMDECKNMGIKVLGPDVNESNLKFTVNKEGNIRFGLGAVKGVGEAAVRCIIEEREKNGPFTDIYDFVQRVNLSACNRKNIECLALSGGFDGFGLKREAYMATNSKSETFSEIIVRYGNKYQLDKDSHSLSLFGGGEAVEVARPEVPHFEVWTDLMRLEKERELIGIYLSAHPLDEYRIVLQYSCNTHMSELENREALKGREITMGGIVIGSRQGMTKQNKPFAILKIEDYSGGGEIALFGQDYVNFHKFCVDNMYLFIRAKVEPRKWDEKILDLRIGTIEQLPDVKDRLIESLTIMMPYHNINTGLIELFKEKLPHTPEASTNLFFEIIDEADPMHPVKLFARPIKISVTNELINYFISNDIRFKINDIEHKEIDENADSDTDESESDMTDMLADIA